MDTSKQYVLQSILRILVEFKILPHKILIFFSENIIMHKLIMNLAFTNMLEMIFINSNCIKIVLLILILL
jgi:hypothetical protein